MGCYQMSSAAISTLGKIIMHSNAPASTRVRAADRILNHTTKAIEIEDIEARVAALERVAPQNKDDEGTQPRLRKLERADRRERRRNRNVPQPKGAGRASREVACDAAG